MQLTFRSSKIVYYGPHECSQCGVSICKMGSQWGGNAFTYPSPPIYPNTEWHVHICKPEDVRGKLAKVRVFEEHSRPCRFSVGQRVAWQGQDGPKVATIERIGWPDHNLIFVGDGDMHDFPIDAELCEYVPSGESV